MPSPRKPPNLPPSTASQRAAEHAHAIIERLMKEMYEGICNPDYRSEPEWAKLFGAKESVVVNVQKLVAALAAVPDYRAAAEEVAMPPLSAAELSILQDWLGETRGN